MQRCPHCGIAHPTVEPLHSDPLSTIGRNSGKRYEIQTLYCTSCGQPIVSFREFYMEHGSKRTYDIRLLPVAEQASSDLPEKVRSFISQALASMHAPDGAGMLAASAIDAMLKTKGLTKGSLHERIEKAHADGLLIDELAEWAHEVRVVANSIRHADVETAPLTPEQAKESVEFAVQLGELWFGMPARIQRRRQTPEPS